MLVEIIVGGKFEGGFFFFLSFFNGGVGCSWGFRSVVVAVAVLSKRGGCLRLLL